MLNNFHGLSHLGSQIICGISSSFWYPEIYTHFRQGRWLALKGDDLLWLHLSLLGLYVGMWQPGQVPPRPGLGWSK